MIVTCYPSRGKVKALRLCRAFAKGVPDKGGDVATVGQRRLEPGGAFFYGWTPHTVPLIEQCRAEGRDWYYADNSYYSGKGKYFRITRNGLMLTSIPVTGTLEGQRRFALFNSTVSPWQTGGAHIVVATQSELFYVERLGTTRDAWVEQVVAELKKHTDREIVVCHKPPTPWPKGYAHANFDAALPGCWAVVSYTSSCMVKALLEGVPVFSLEPSMVGRFGLSDLARIETPYRPSTGRRTLMETLACNQWTRHEMSSGLAWRALQKPS